MSTEGGRTSFQDVSECGIVESVRLLHKEVAKRKAAYKDLSVLKITQPDEIVRIIRRSQDSFQACSNLQKELGFKKATAEFILELPLAELSDLNESMIADRLKYYTHAEKSLKELM